MKLILREDVHNLGKSGELVTVKDGFGRNYLLPAQAGGARQRAERAPARAREGGDRRAPGEAARPAPRSRPRSSSAVQVDDRAARSASRTSCSARSPRWTSPRRWPPRARRSTAATSTCPSRSRRVGTLRGGDPAAPRRDRQDQGRGRRRELSQPRARGRPRAVASRSGLRLSPERSGLASRSAPGSRCDAWPSTAQRTPIAQSTRISPPSARCSGAVLADNTVIADVAEVVHPDDFASPAHAQIFAAMLGLDGTPAHGRPPHPRRGAEDPRAARRGGRPGLPDGAGPGGPGRRQRGRSTRRSSRTRRCGGGWRSVGREIQELASQDTGELDGAARRGRAQGLPARREEARGRPAAGARADGAHARPARQDEDVVERRHRALHRLRRPRQAAHRPARRASCIILAARPGIGKTSLAMNIAHARGAQGEAARWASSRSKCPRISC